MKLIFLKPLTICHLSRSRLSSQVQTNVQSSLYITGKRAQEQFSVIRPSYDVQYLRYLSSNLESIKTNMTRRAIAIDNIQWNSLQDTLQRFSSSLAELNVLKKKREKLNKKMKKQNKIPDEAYKQLTQEYVKVKQNFNELENKVIPFVLSVPNNIRSDVKDQPEVIDRCAGIVVPKVSNQPALDYIRLGYINNTFQPSLNGPNAKYLIGESAQLYHALCHNLQDTFQSSNYELVSGLDIVKSALVEAVNLKDYSSDPSMIRSSHDFETIDQRLHLVGDGSLEALCAQLTKKEIQPSQFFQIGCVYEGSPIEQKHCLNVSIISEPKQSNDQMEQLYQIIWSFLSNKLQLRCESIRASASSLGDNEYARYDIISLLPSRKEWIPIGQIVHHSYYVMQRLGVSDYKSNHLVTSHLDLIQLIKSILEHYHVPTNARLIRPECLIEFYLN